MRDTALASLMQRAQPQVLYRSGSRGLAMGRVRGYVSISYLMEKLVSGFLVERLLWSTEQQTQDGYSRLHFLLFTAHDLPWRLPTRIGWRLAGVQPLAMLLYIKGGQGHSWLRLRCVRCDAMTQHQHQHQPLPSISHASR